MAATPHPISFHPSTDSITHRSGAHAPVIRVIAPTVAPHTFTYVQCATVRTSWNWQHWLLSSGGGAIMSNLPSKNHFIAKQSAVIHLMTMYSAIKCVLINRFHWCCHFVLPPSCVDSTLLGNINIYETVSSFNGIVFMHRLLLHLVRGANGVKERNWQHSPSTFPVHYSCLEPSSRVFTFFVAIQRLTS